MVNADGIKIIVQLGAADIGLYILSNRHTIALWQKIRAIHMWIALKGFDEEVLTYYLHINCVHSFFAFLQIELNAVAFFNIAD